MKESFLFNLVEYQQLYYNSIPRRVRNLGIEPSNGFETCFLNQISQSKQLVKKIGYPRMKKQLDTFHANIEEKSIEDAIKKTEQLLCHIQIGENDKGTPGTGSIRWDGIANAIKEIGYDRWLVIETFPPWYEGVRACVWRPLAPDQDEIARGGLQFLRRLLGSGV